MKQTEIERKFLIDHVPDDLDRTGGETIQQGYLSIESNREVRIRKRSEVFTLTVKQGSGIAREEVEIEISRQQFDYLWPLTEGRRIDKTRYCYQRGDHTIEINIFGDRLSPLMMAEVEFDSLEAAADFVPPDFLSEEVTEDPDYRNMNLALREQAS